MGFKDILKAIFGPKLERVVVNIDQLESWVNEKTEKAVSSKMDADKRIFDEFNSIVAVLNKTINDLEFAELLNDKIDQKLKNYMIGNREAYVKQMRIFLASIPDFEDEFTEEFQKLLSEFSEKTRRNFAVLTEFFKDTMINIARNLKRMSELSEQMQYDDEKIVMVEDIKRELANLLNFEIMLVQMKKEIEQIDAKISKASDYITESQSKISELKASKEYELMQNLANLIKEEREKLKKSEYEIYELFSPLKKPLKKFSYIAIASSDKKLIDAYVEDPVEALLKDIKLTIIDVLYRMEKGLSNLDVKDSEKSREHIAAVTKEKLESAVRDFKKLRTLIYGAQADIEKIEIMKEIEKIDREMDQASAKQDELDGEKKKIEDRVEAMNKEEIIEHIRKHIRDLLKIDLVIDETQDSVTGEEPEEKSEEESDIKEKPDTAGQ